MEPSSPFLARCTLLTCVIACLAAGPAYGGTCSSPAGNETNIIYNSAYHTYQFCNGTNWIPYQAGSTWLYQAANNTSAPGGSGFFVLSKGIYTGNLGGGLAGADSTCLSDLTTNTGWLGYAAANGAGQLVSGNVHAFICVTTGCNNLTASTTYYFANAGNSSAGGASFTTNSSGEGPNDSADWAAANYFSGDYTFWSSRGVVSATVWNTSYDSQNSTCTNYTTNSSGVGGHVGYTAMENAARWSVTATGAALGCNVAAHLLCYVNP